MVYGKNGFAPPAASAIDVTGVQPMKTKQGVYWLWPDSPPILSQKPVSMPSTCPQARQYVLTSLTEHNNILVVFG